MFDNTVKLPSGNTGGDDLTVTSIIDGPSNRKTLRSSADGMLQFTIAHNESNENPGFVTQRSNVRIAQLIELDDTDKTLTAYAQLTLSFPKGYATTALMQSVVNKLVGFILMQENAGGDGSGLNDTALASVPRLMAGEP